MWSVRVGVIRCLLCLSVNNKLLANKSEQQGSRWVLGGSFALLVLGHVAKLQ